jgi:glycosyltransferase involved in cell wall biosynthesis
MEDLGGLVVNTPKISVIMLTYNRETLVSRMIDCILTQSFIDFEFVIINNGSSDRSGLIADEYAAKYNRIRVIHRERGNIGSGRNAGIDAARGEYIAFVDDDDYCEPDFLEFMYLLATENNADISICGATDKCFDDKIIFTPENAVIELLWRKRFNVQFPTKLIRRKLFNNFRFSEIAKYDDIELMPQIIASANCIAYHGLPKYTFERHDNNNSAWTTNHNLLNAGTLNEYLTVYRNRTEWLSQRFPENAKTWRYFEWSFMISMVEKITRLNLSDCESLRNEMLSELSLNCKKFENCELIQDFEKEWFNKYVK